MSDQNRILDKLNNLIADHPENDELRSLKSLIENQQNHLGLTFNEDKLDPTDGVVRIKGRVPELERVDQLAIRKGRDKTNNQLIEADNMYALSALARLDKKYDVIYIDPPYNTGNDDLGYEDNRVADDDSFRDTKWLAFMKPRLTLARTLLKDTGVIFVSIDDNEQAYLKVLMDEIFGKRNFVGNIVRRTRTGTELLSSGIDTNIEYVLIYKVGKLPVLVGKKKDLSKYKNPDHDAHGAWTPNDPSVGGNSSKRNFEIKNPYTGQIDRPPVGRHWTFDESEIKSLVEQGKLAFYHHETFGRSFVYKRYANEVKNPYAPLKSYDSFFDNDLNAAGNRDFIQISGERTFSYPKPVSFIKKLIRSIGNKSASVLDFFAGTGTTGQSVLSLNKEDGGHRTFTLVTSRENSVKDPEKNIARDITYQRLFKVINGYKTPKGKVIEGLDANLDYFRITDDSLIKKEEIDSLSYDKERFGWQCSEFAIQHNAHLVRLIDETTALFSIDGQRLAILASDLLDDDLIVASLKKEEADGGSIKEIDVYKPYPMDAHSSLAAWADENGVRLN